MSAAKNWCFTLNNYTEDEMNNFFPKETCDFHDGGITYYICGKEKGEQGTPHLQGYVQFKKKIRMNQVKNWFKTERIHLEIAKGSPDNNIKYCSKEGDFITFGTPLKSGARNDINELYTRIQGSRDWNEVLKIHGIEKYMNYAKEVWASKPVEKVPELKPNFFQQAILDILKKEPDDRHITYVYDEKGGAGKTTLCKYLKCNHGAFYCSPAKSMDILHAYNGEKVVLYDIPKSCDEDYVNWGAIEKLKDGIFFSGKYQSGTKVRSGNCHIIIFANSDVPENKFSKDRIIRINAANYKKEVTYIEI